MAVLISCALTGIGAVLFGVGFFLESRAMMRVSVFFFLPMLFVIAVIMFVFIPILALGRIRGKDQWPNKR